VVIRFTIPITPKAQARDKIAVIGGKARSYTSKEQRLAADKLLSLLMLHKPPEMLLGAINLQVKVYMPIPKSKPRKWRESALRGEVRPTTKPDVSNMIKHLEDVMSGVYFHDDKQIVDLAISKYYDETPHWEIEITEV